MLTSNMNSQRDSRSFRNIGHIAVLLALGIMSTGCGSEDSESENTFLQAIQGTKITESANGPPIQFINTTGYSNSLKIGWEAVPGADLYALTKTDGDTSEIFWVEGTRFVDSEVPPDTQPRYSLMSNSASEGLSPSGEQVTGQNNREIAAAINKRLRSAGSRPEVKRILKLFMALYFDRIFVGSDAEGLNFYDRAMLFSFFVAHNYVPYGNSNKFELMELLQEQTLDCDNYAVFAGLMFHLITDQKQLKSLAFIGFDGGPIGNHAQLIYRPEAGGIWLVDPTVGLIATFDSATNLLNGGIAHRISDYYAYFDNPLQPADIPPWIVRIKTALREGGYRQEHVIYRYPTLSAYMRHW